MGTPKVNSDFADARFRQFAPALGKVGQYQMSAVPYITSSVVVPAPTASPKEIAFPSVTRFVTVINEATGSPNKPLRVGFSSFGVTGSSANDTEQNNYFTLDNGESYTGEWRVSKVYLLGSSPAVLDNDGDPVAGGAGTVYPTTASVIAGLTGIPHDALMANWSGSSGVG